jgi:hypothetical protein
MFHSMHITARLEETTVRTLLGELLPVTIVLDEDEGEHRWIRIDPARTVEFVANEGLRLEVGGQLHWKAAGVPVLLTIHAAQLLITPEVVDGAEGGRLVFRPSLEKMDLKSVPGFLDSGITAIVNKRLEAEGDKLAWPFGSHLANRFPLPKELLDVDRFTLAAGRAMVHVLDDAIVFNLSLAMGFTRRPRTDTSDQGPSAPAS